MSGRAKKLSMDPNLDEKVDTKESSNTVIGANHKQHPLLINLVMDTLFKQYSLLKHDGSTALAALAKLRGVCKTWNDEIGKMVRKQTRINVGRIVAAYPQGLGWEANANGFNYSAPMPEKIGTFENIDLIITRCADLTSSSIIQWFQVMGGSVKSLRLQCPLTCYHQSRFMEKILKEWCPNLKSFTLKGACCFESLVLNSFFVNQTPLQNQCSSLKEFVLYTDYNFWKLNMDLCGESLPGFEKSGEKQLIRDVDHLKILHRSHLKFVNRLNKYMSNAGEPDTTIDQEHKLLTNLVKRPIGLTSLDGLSPASFGPHVLEFLRNQFECDPGFETDGGVMGQLMRMSKVEKFVIQYGGSTIFKELLSMFLFRPSLWLSSIQDFEFVDNCEGLHVREKVYNVLMTVFSKLGFPVKRMKFEGGRLDFFVGNDHAATLEKIVTSYADSLEDLEIKWKVHGFYDWLDFPVLPKLKTLVVDCVGDCVVNPAKEDFWVKFPNLEKCILTDESLTHTSLFETEPVGIFSHPMKVLKLLDGYHLDNIDVQRIAICFPNLKTVELSIVWGSEEAFRGFWEETSRLALEHVKMTTYYESFPQTAIEDNIANFQDLKSLEFVHEGTQPFVLSRNFSNAFAMAPKLRFLKFTNFQVMDNAVEEFKRNLPRCVVQVPE